MRRNKGWLAFSMILWGLVLVGSIVLYQALRNDSFDWPNISLPNDNYVVEVQRGTIDASINRINIEWIVGNVTVIVEDRPDILWVEMATVELKDTQRATVTVTNQNVRIKSNIRTVFSFLFQRTPKSEITLYLPETVLDLLLIESTSGKVEVDGVESKRMDLTATSGSVKLTSLLIDEFDLTMTSGKFTVKDSTMVTATVQMTSGKTEFEANVMDMFDFSMTSGVSDLTILNPDLKRMTLNMTSGSTELTLLQDADFRLITSYTSGSIKVSSEVYQEGTTYFTKNRTNLYQLDMTSGRFKLNIQP